MSAAEVASIEQRLDGGVPAHERHRRDQGLRAGGARDSSAWMSWTACSRSRVSCGWWALTTSRRSSSSSTATTTPSLVARNSTSQIPAPTSATQKRSMIESTWAPSRVPNTISSTGPPCSRPTSRSSPCGSGTSALLTDITSATAAPLTRLSPFRKYEASRSRRRRSRRLPLPPDPGHRESSRARCRSGDPRRARSRASPALGPARGRAR